ncbi:hypothetical protein GBAR_LOCUS1966 [Geodia barretti]|uniref:Uncharacterized protein n=1 Tax=Geodia barretti TaxID=519541 RepID=A0AA35QY73_GEOBA|nr:hypothetical protein GBAR_LOCUS1966 [Geodia barretti]
MKEDKKRRTGREREREESEGRGRQGGMVETPRPEEPRPSSLRRSPSPQEPGYQTISTATAATATARVHPSSGAQQAPTTIYQTIDEVGTSASSRGTSPLPPLSSSSYVQHEGGSAREVSASPARVAAGVDRGGEGGEASVSSTPLVPEEIVPDPNATYAAVEQIKERKRTSRREKERQKIEQEQQEHLHHQPPPPLLEEPSDSWV